MRLVLCYEHKLSSVPLYSPSLQTHTCEATALVKALYHDFCVLLPDAFEPLFQVPATSVHFAQQLVVVFTALYPFHTGESCAYSYMYNCLQNQCDTVFACF